MPPSSPVVAGWELALRLRERRRQRGMDVLTVTKELGFTRNYWSAVENERKILSEETLNRVLDLFEFDAEERQELLELRSATRERGWWSRYSGMLDAGLQRLFGLEAGAHSIRGYESLLIPGLLQTPGYARAIMAASVTLPRVEIDQRVEVRVRRQQRLFGDDPMLLTAIISEATLLQQIGGPDVLRHQLEHLIRIMEKHSDTIEVRVLPFTVTNCDLFGAATFELIDFEQPMLPTVAWHESITIFGTVDDPMRVRDMGKTYGEALRRTLDQNDSLVLIRQHLRELH